MTVPAIPRDRALDRALAGASAPMPSGERMSELRAESVIASWHDRPRALTSQLLEQLGEPDEVTRSRLIWYRRPLRPARALPAPPRAARQPDGRWRVMLTVCDEDRPPGSPAGSRATEERPAWGSRAG